MSLIQSLFLCVGSIFAAVNGLHWLLLILLCLLATHALLPESNIVQMWPIGLMLVMVALYAGYWVMWFRSTEGVTEESAKVLFISVACFFGLVSLIRHVRGREQKTGFSFAASLSTIIICILPVVLISIATLRWGNDPARLISGFVAGGDHNVHNEITHNLLAWSSTTSFSNPMQVYIYPNGIHFLIANLVALSSSGSGLSTLVQELRMGAWFEMVQLAAYAQLALVVFIRGSKGSSLRRAVFVAPLIFVFASMDNFVGHLFWSGFTTSLGMTWLLLVPFVLPWSTSEKGSIVGKVAWLLLMSFAAWIIYQPYAIPLFVVAMALVSFYVLHDKRQSLFSTYNANENLIFGLLVGAGTFVVALTPFVVRGSESPAVSSLLLDGATSRPYFYTVALWAVIAITGLKSLLSKSDSFMSVNMIRLSVLMGVVALTTSMILIVILESDYGLLKQPYYTTKMLWVVLFISIPIALSAVLSMFENWLNTIAPREKTGYLAVVFCVLLLIPLVMGRYPKAALSHGVVDWFASGLIANEQALGDRTMAFARGDILGSHVSNLALRSFSGVIVPIDIGISGNPYLACKFVNRENIDLLYTTGNGKAEMVLSGCKDELRYVVDGTLMTNEEVPFFGIPANVDVDLTTEAAALQHMQRGLIPYTKAGNFATGYRSTIVFSFPSRFVNPSLQLNFLTTIEGPADKSVTVLVNGVAQSRVETIPGQITSLTIPLPSGEAGTGVKIGIDCSWSDEETRKVDPYGYPPACLKLMSMRLVS